MAIVVGDAFQVPVKNSLMTLSRTLSEGLIRIYSVSRFVRNKKLISNT